MEKIKIYISVHKDKILYLIPYTIFNQRYFPKIINFLNFDPRSDKKFVKLLIDFNPKEFSSDDNE